MEVSIAAYAYENLAKICHEANKAYCETIGDNSQPSWEDAPQWQKDSAITGVRFHSLTKNTTAADSHNSWLKEKEADGWKYGEVKNPDLKEHPCFVPYEQLPKSQKIKDYIFKGIIDAYNAGVKSGGPRELTQGEELVGLKFNPSSLNAVDKAKKFSAELIDMVLEDHEEATMGGKSMASWNRNILKTAAINAVIAAQMAVVKVLTWKDK